MRLLPSKRQWGSWSLPSKASVAGVWLGVLALLVTLVFWALDHAGPGSDVGGAARRREQEVSIVRAINVAVRNDLLATVNVESGIEKMILDKRFHAAPGLFAAIYSPAAELPPTADTSILPLEVLGPLDDFRRRLSECARQHRLYLDALSRPEGEGTEAALLVYCVALDSEIRAGLILLRRLSDSYPEQDLGDSGLARYQPIEARIEGLSAAVREGQDQRRETRRTEDPYASLITGGDSYAYLLVVQMKDETDEARLMVAHEGQYPLYDINVRVCDLDLMDQLASARSRTLAEWEKAWKSVDVGNLAPHYAREMGRLALPGAGTVRLNVFINARNGQVTQLIRLARTSGGWKRASRVQRDLAGGPRILREDVDRGYPGSPAW